MQESETVRIAKKHFDWALAQYFQVGKPKICPQFCPPVARDMLVIEIGDL